MEEYSEYWNGRVWVIIPIGEGTPLHIDAKELIKQCFHKEEVSPWERRIRTTEKGKV